MKVLNALLAFDALIFLMQDSDERSMTLLTVLVNSSF
jgi:hypothetical protein